MMIVPNEIWDKLGKAIDAATKMLESADCLFTTLNGKIGRGQLKFNIDVDK